MTTSSAQHQADSDLQTRYLGMDSETIALQKSAIEGGIALLLDQVLDITVAQFNSEQKDVSIWILERVLEADYDNARVHHELSLLYLACQRSDKALEHLEQAASIDPDNTARLKCLADFYWNEKGDAKAALKHYIRVLSLAPTDAEAILDCGKICTAIESDNGARDLFTRILEVSQTNQGAGQLLTQIEESSHRHTQTIGTATIESPAKSTRKTNQLPIAAVRQAGAKDAAAAGKLPISVIVPLSRNRHDFFNNFVLPLIEANNPMEIIINEDAGSAPKKRNDGFKRSTQPFVFFCDDDIMLPKSHLQKLLENLQNNMSRTDKRIGYSYTGYDAIVLNPSNHPMKGNYEVGAEPFSASNLRRYNYISTMSLMAREVFPFFDESLNRFQDWDLYLTLLENGVEGVLTEDIKFFAYYLDEGITSESNNLKESVEIIYKKHQL